MTTEPKHATIFVINLARSRERLASISTRMRQYGISFIRHRAVDGKRHHELIRRRVGIRFTSLATQRPLTKGEIGCLLSHVSVMRRILRSGLSMAVVLEDDAVWDEEFASLTQADIERMLRICDVVKLHGTRRLSDEARGIPLARIPTGLLSLPFAQSAGTVGYAVSARGARALLKLYSSVGEPSDFAMARCDSAWAVLGEVKPYVVWSGASVSTIEENRWQSDAQPTSRSITKRVVRIVSRLARRSVLGLTALLRGAAGMAIGRFTAGA